jgi:large subunit ribosomal protein L29
MIKLEEIRGLSAEELRDKVNALKKELMQLRFQAKTGKLEQQTKMRETRRDIARILTVACEKKKEAKS